MIRLLADIGGTNTRCALVRDGSGPTQVRHYQNAEFAGPAALLGAYVQALPGEHRPRAAALAVAAPIQGDQVRMINIDWRFSAAALRQSLGLERLELLNDFAALAQALPVLPPDALRQVGGGTCAKDQTRAVLGPGTGLGVAGLVRCGDEWLSISGEGGHVTLAPGDETEAALIAAAADRYGHCSAERLISGPGLALIHAQLHGVELDAREIGTRAANDEPESKASLEILFSLLGGVAGNLALTLGAAGGVYIGGGIVPRYIEQFARSSFRQRFIAKGRYRDYLDAIPTWVITAADPTLLGLAAWSARWR